MGVFGNYREYDFLCGCFPKCVCAVYMRVHVCMFDRGRRREREKRVFWVGNISKRQKP